MKATFFLIALVCTVVSAQEAVFRVTFVCDDKENPPYFTGSGSEQNNYLKPGSVIDFIRIMEIDLGIKIDVLRQPIKAALETTLKTGKADAIFCIPWSEEAEKIAVFPRVNGRLDEASQLFSNTYVLYKPKDAPLGWDGESKSLTGNATGKPVGISYGSEVTEDLKALGVPLKADFSSALSAFIIMQKGDISGVVIRESVGTNLLKANPELAAKVVKIGTPIVIKPYFVVFSKQFSERNQFLTKKISEYVRKNHALYEKTEERYLPK